MSIGDFFKFYISLLVVCNPFSAIPAMLGLTRSKPLEEKQRTAKVTSFAIAVIFLLSVWIGSPLLKFFDIRISAFQVAGGFVLFILAFSLLNAEESSISYDPTEQKEAQKKSSIAVVPLAIPIISGPGAISTAIVFNTNFPGINNRLIMTVCSLLVAFTLGICLYFATRLEKLLGHTGMNIMGRIGGLILAAIAVETMSKGFVGLFPGLLGSLAT